MYAPGNTAFAGVGPITLPRHTTHDTTLTFSHSRLGLGVFIIEIRRHVSWVHEVYDDDDDDE